MVTAATSFGRNGLADWVVQRASALVMTAYVFFLLYFIFATPDFGYEAWKELYSQLWMRIFSLLALLSIVAHAWIGIWAVLTDYFTTRLMGPKATAIRLVCQLLLAVVLVTFLVWGIEILWGL
ncbi:succinate dehydrogenase, hydrophobic membrane anchor protein [Biformimicrobium ophioploci]|uniref:Succinate dehydrogenase hydrophobic membrane anchor subunit n=1 Tax=Biformimicrobium ophioploci TaxID=3036711 RepID=A0ABQ6LZ75_9GAMM|nr:succinate dehydrogenase, hydrophobic membrane anchor protein [Microbulbifer sp. NKW57]GMG87335.1 succinate dehydrogenase, hydrophobic membrane anchor protein [Microbulbifer sp. NKW57]